MACHSLCNDIFEHAVSEINKNKCADYIVEYLLEFFEIITECFLDTDEMEHPQQFEHFSDMLKEEYLWPEEYDEDEEICYEDEEMFPEELFYSFWYYSFQVLVQCWPMLKKLENSSSQHWSVKAKELKELIIDYYKD